MARLLFVLEKAEIMRSSQLPGARKPPCSNPKRLDYKGEENERDVSLMGKMKTL